MEQAKTTEPVFQPDSESTTTASGDIPSPTQASFDVKDPVKDNETKEKNDVGWEAQTCPGADESSITSKSLALLKRFKISEGFFSLKTLLELALARLSAATSVWHPFPAANLEPRALRFGALAALFLFIFLRHRHTWRRYDDCFHLSFALPVVHLTVDGDVSFCSRTYCLCFILLMLDFGKHTCCVNISLWDVTCGFYWFLYYITLWEVLVLPTTSAKLIFLLSFWQACRKIIQCLKSRTQWSVAVGV